MFVYCFFFNDTATTEIYTLSLHDALPISACWLAVVKAGCIAVATMPLLRAKELKPVIDKAQCNAADRKSTRLNSSHVAISYAVFCLKKKKKSNRRHRVMTTA